MSGTTLPPETRPRQFRRRRARIAAVVTVAAIAVGLAGWRLAGVGHRDETYRPGEEVAGITRDLEKDARGAPALVFADATAAAGLSGFATFSGDRTSQLPEDMGGGAAWGDFDNDGDDDLFLVSAGGPLHAPDTSLAPSQLYENKGNGTFQHHEGFPELKIRGMGAAWADFDNDGWLDLAVTGYHSIRLFANRQGRFHPLSSFRSRPGFWTGVSWGDFNRDGRPDLYVCGYVKYRFDSSQRSSQSQQFGQSVPHTLNPSSYEPERNLLFRNDGNGSFAETAAALGVDNPTGRSLSALWHDFDDNGTPDLYVANDISESKLYLNLGGRFEDAGRKAWIGEYRGSMGLAAGDFDRDGDDDLFISHWVAQQFALYESLWAQQDLIKNRNGGSKARELHFTDVAGMKGIGQPTLRSIGWGAEFADLDSDGWLDLVVAAGSTFEAEGSPKRLIGMPSFLFSNRAGESFQNLAASSKAFGAERVGRGLAVSDYDLDGDLDVAIVDLDGGVRLLRNDTKQGQALRLQLRGNAGRPWSGADGAVVTAWLKGTPLRRTISSASYLSQSTRMVHIGIGAAKQADRLEIRWPDGRKDSHGPIAAGAMWSLTPGSPPAARAPIAGDREKQLAFWDRHRAAMDLLKRSGDTRGAAALFREALALDPNHEDARYYLASCLASEGDVPGAIRELSALLRVNPDSQRALQRLAALRAHGARTSGDLQRAAEEALRAHTVNPEETGALLLLGEIDLLRGQAAAARKHLNSVVRSNHRSSLAFFLLAYLDWKAGRAESSRLHLAAMIKARGPEWKPRGSVNEGDVQRRMHAETSLLGGFADSWDGQAAPDRSFAALSARLAAKQR